jgi:lipoprotein-anchoring transpeptidase ErfK/SrfK
MDNKNKKLEVLTLFGLILIPILVVSIYAIFDRQRVTIVEITPPPPTGVIRDVPQSDYKPVQADTEFIPTYYLHKYEIPEELQGTEEIWIEVDLGGQRLYVHEGERLVAGFRISSGKEGMETKTGLFRIYAMYPSYPMWGPDYHTPDVPWTMFFHTEFAIHGAYWHDSFGTPVSHGCVNLAVNDAEWVYGNVKKGTYVHVHE